MNGIIVLNKPAGITSRKAVDEIIRLTGEKKAGHAGTLDPFAVGVLPVCLGKATRIADYIRKGMKTYTTTLRLGVETDTLDITGSITRKFPMDNPFPISVISQTLQSFLGIYEQTIPEYSARKIDGRRSYAIAREGGNVPLRKSQVTLYEINLKRYRHPVIRFEVSCSEGTYIRALGSDIGRQLGCGGVLISLIRTRTGPFSLIQARSLKKLQCARNNDCLGQAVLPTDAGAALLPRVMLDLEAESWFKQGRLITDHYFSVPDPPPKSEFLYAIYTMDSRFLGIGRIESSQKHFGMTLKTEKFIDIQS
jgi:tRNA pseudouridine55 synthase